MADGSKIEWTDATWNPIRGCSLVSEGCRNCYAMNVAARFSGKGQAYEGLAYRNESGAHWTGKVRLIEEHLEDPLRWKRPRRIFVNSMSDLFHESLSFGQIFRVFLVMQQAPQHVFQVLTKRPARMKEFIEWMAIWGEATALAMDAAEYFHWPYPNTWPGVSCEDQKTADERIPLLLETPAAVRWISAEPLLGPMDFSLGNMIGGAECYCGDFVVGDHGPFGADTCRVCRCKGVRGPWTRDANRRLDWIVVGGESGPSARPMHPDWARSLRDQCVAAKVPFFFKQHGEWLHQSQTGAAGYDESQIWRRFAEQNAVKNNVAKHIEFGGYTYRVGKKAAGRVLDGREWNEYPQAKAVAA